MGDTNNTNQPNTAVSGGNSFAVIAAGKDHACALTTAGAAKCWGSNSSGQLGLAGGSSSTPATVTGGHVFIGLSAGDSSTCAMKTTGSAYCWGSNGSKQLGDSGGSGASSTSPVQVTGSGTSPIAFTNMASGSSTATHHCGLVETDYEGRLAADGSYYASFIKADGSVWIADYYIRPSPYWTKRANGTDGYTKVFQGGGFAPLFIKSDGSIWFWNIDTLAFQVIYPGWPAGFSGSWLSAAAGYNFFAAVKSDGSFWIDAGPSYTPALWAAGSFKKTVAGFNSWCVLTQGTQQLQCAGAGDYYQLGTGSNAHSYGGFSTISGGGIWRDVGAASYYTCGIRFDGSLYCWGLNNVGQLGVGDTTNRTVPTRVGLRKWKRIDMPMGGSNGTENFACALTPGNDAYCWGATNYGFGDGGVTKQSLVPLRIANGYKWQHVSLGRTGACGFTPDEKVYCWGGGYWWPWDGSIPVTLQNF